MGLPLALPDASKRKMLGGLRAFAEGKIVRRRWAPQKDLDVRKLLVLEALSHYGQANPRRLDSILLTHTRWPKSAVIHWLALLRRMPANADHTAKLAHARPAIIGILLSI